MHKRADAYRSIGEAARLVGVATHVLRYWETQFAQLKPMRRPDGRRYYRPDDVRLAAGLAIALREDGLTTRGAARLIAKDGGAELRARGAARLPEAFALSATPHNSDEQAGEQRGATATEPAKPTPAISDPPRPPPPASRASPIRAAPTDTLPLFSDVAPDGETTDSTPATTTDPRREAPQPAAGPNDIARGGEPSAPRPPLTRIKALTRHLQTPITPPPQPELEHAIARLREFLAQR